MRPIEDIIALIHSDTLNHVIADQIEGQDLDFKEWSYRSESEKNQWRDNRSKILEMAVCMANGGGGHVVYGIADNKMRKENSFIGIPLEVESNKIISYIYQNTEPRIQAQVNLINVEYGTGIIMIISTTGESPPYTQADGSAKIRQGSDCIPLTGTIRRHMMQRQHHFDYSNELIDKDWKELISASALEYIRKNMKEQHSPIDLTDLSDYELLQRINAIRDGKLTRGGLLLFGNAESIHQHIPTHQWAYRSMKSDTEYTYREEGYDSIALAAKELGNNINRGDKIVTREVDLFHQEYYTYPAIAIREALINALVHRDYELPGAVMVKQYPERLEVSNPGSFISGIHPDNILHHASTPRNIHLMDLLDKVRLVNRTNLGVPRIFQALLQEGKEPPVYEDSGAQIKLTLFSSEITPAFATFVEEEQELGNPLKVDDLLVIQYLLKHSRANLTDLAKTTQRSKDTAKDQLSILIDKKILETIDSGQAYILSQRVSEAVKNDLAYVRNHELDEERVKLQILSYMEKRGRMTRASIIQMTGWSGPKVYRFMQKLRSEGIVKSVGRGKAAYYALGEEE